MHRGHYGASPVLTFERVCGKAGAGENIKSRNFPLIKSVTVYSPVKNC